MTDLSAVLPWLSLILAGIAIFGFFDQRRNVAIREGVRAAESLQLRKDVDSAHDKIRVLDASSRGVDVCMAAVQTKLDNIEAKLANIERKLDGRVE